MSPTGSITEPKIAQGPVKSMSTTPRDSGYATGIVPLVGGFRGFAAAADPEESAPPIRAEAPRPATLLAASENGTAAMKPAAPDLLSNSLRFIPTSPPVFLYKREAYAVTRIRNVKELSIRSKEIGDRSHSK